MINQRVVESRHFPAVRRFVDRWYGLDSDTARDRLDRLRNPSTGSMDRAKVYLSRSRLPARLRHVRGEEELERELEKFGWRIVYPETLPILEQLETLHSARAVAGCIGSAFHLLMYFGMDIANKLVIGLGAIDGKMSPTYVLQFRQQGLNFLHICCLEPARFMKKSKGGSRQQNLAFSVPPRAIALQMEQLTCQHS